ncbi:MAG TPA: hypothetical protein VEN82_04385 [Actinomycetota bacterium]|nr:hypothetical protein [Actinomycetota bacterium]
MSAGVIAAVAGLGTNGGRPSLPAGPARPVAPPIALVSPPSSVSLYMESTDPGVLSALGCRLARDVIAGRAPRDALVVLDFGHPVHKGGRFGTVIYGGGGFRPTAWIRQGAQAYARGFGGCMGPVPEASLLVALGTSNYGHQVSLGHGRAWAAMVNAASDWLTAHPSGPAPLSFAGADDIEPGWNSPAVSRRWVDGYDAVGRFPYYDFGGAAKCPPYGSCANGWTQEDVWYVSSGAPLARALPEVYTESGASADQWYAMAQYSLSVHGEPLRIEGVMSERGACTLVRDPCAGIDNTPAQAWRQLAQRLAADPLTSRPIRWVTDITYQR